ncbi:MAG: hypothetical protein N3F05_03375 [Candidatus Diapherotrites archaeon]|nr:hypothetical protein [Candidatus Diapherotrites archaeon]
MARKKPENLKTKRERKRYVLFTLEGHKSESNFALFGHIKSFIRQKMGEKFLQKASLKLIEFDGKFGILQCERSSKDAIVETLRKNSERAGKVAIRTLSASGTLKALRKRKNIFKLGKK